MATKHTLTITELATLAGNPYAKNIRAYVVTNLPKGEALIDTTTNEIMAGGLAITLLNGSGSVSLPATDATDLNVVANTVQYEVRAEYVDPATRGRETWRSGYFALTADANLADVATDASPMVVTVASQYAQEAKDARDDAVAITGISTSDAAVEALVKNTGGVGPLTSAALSATIEAGVNDAKADPYAIQRIDRRAIEKARAGAGAAIAAYADATELTKDWADLTGWQAAANAQVSGNKLYAVSATNPGGALKGFTVGTGEVAHISALFYWKAGGAGATYFGIDLGTVDHAPAASSPDGIFIGINGAGSVAPFKGSNLAAVTWSAAVGTGVITPSIDTTYYMSIDIGTDFISFSMRDVSNPNNLTYFYVTRSTIVSAGKAINNIAVFLTDARGTSGNAIGPVTAIKSRQPTRTKALAGQTNDGSAHRFIATAVPLGNPWRVQLPKTYDPRTPSPVVIWCHQSLTGDADDPWTETRMQPLTTALADAGYIFASTGDTDSWGNATGLTEYTALYEHIRDRYNTGPVFFIGVSMGALVALNLMARRTFPTPAAFVSIGGVCNLDDLYAGRTGAYYPGIETAYGFSGAGNYEAATAGFNPIDREGWEFRGVPMRFYTSTGDTAVPKTTGCDVLAAKVAPFSPEATVSVKSGGHLDTSQYPPSEIVTFFNTYR